MPDPTDFDFDFDVKRPDADRDDNGASRGAEDRDRGNGVGENGERGLAGPEALEDRPQRNGGRSGKRSRKGNGRGNGRRPGERSIAGLSVPTLGRKTGARDEPEAVDEPFSDEPLPPAGGGDELSGEPSADDEPVSLRDALNPEPTSLKDDDDAPADLDDEPAKPEGPESLDDYLKRVEGPKRPRRPSAPTAPRPRGNGRQLGGVALPDLDGLAERVKSLRIPGTKPGDGDGAPPAIPRIRLPGLPGMPGRPARHKKGKIKTGRVLIVLTGLGLLALASTFFGMMMAVAGDLPNLENRTEFNESQNSVVYDFKGKKIGTLTPNDRRILVESDDIAQSMKQAAIAIEDERFYEHRGVDYQALIRAGFADIIPGGTIQGASTITQQFVKNALEAQNQRTVFQKFREAALAYHVERQWDKEKILTQYLNTIYFGEGAYGVEAAARTYFGASHPECGEDGEPLCASVLLPEESALLAGIISAPSAYSPRTDPEAALERRNTVLKKMQEQGYLSETEYQRAAGTVLPSAGLIEPPEEDSVQPYFTSWLRQVLVDRYGAGRTFGGGLRVRTSLDLDLQEAAEQAVYGTLSGIIPTGAAVVIDRKTGGIRAMVAGNDFEERPFNLATQGHRQPGSAFKPFTLLTAFENGHSAGETYTSAQRTYTVPNSGGEETFELHNYEDIYYGALDLATATVKSDNNVFMQLGYNIDPRNPQKGFNKIEQTAYKTGIATDITPDHTANPALVLGGLIQGVTPLEMAFAFNTINNEGEKVSGSGASYKGGPVAVLEIKDKDGETVPDGTNHTKKDRVLEEGAASTAKSILGGVISSGGTGRRADTSADGEWGKTGTTDNNGDAWFCGGTEDITACVWVGHHQTNTPMETEFGGDPVDGGTFPALIWGQIVNAYYNIQAARDAGADDVDVGGSSGYVPSGGGSSGSSSGGGGDTGGGGGGDSASPAPAPAPAPSGGGGVGAGL